MSDRRSRVLFVGALTLVCATAFGCREDEYNWNQKTKTDTVEGQITVDNNKTGTEIIAGVNEICRNSEKCMTAPECVGDAAYVACRCVVDRLCSENPQCNGINDSAPGSNYTCEYTCSLTDPSGACNWNVCASNTGCFDPNTCTTALAQRFPSEDADKDGINNGVEIAAGWDPCNPDSDGDGVPDGQEDLNYDGRIDLLLGETDPADPKSHADTTTGEAKAREVACNPKILDGKFKTVNGDVNVALFGDVPESNYQLITGAGTNKEVLLFNDTKTGVYGSYFHSSVLYDVRVVVINALTADDTSFITSEEGKDVIQSIIDENNGEGGVPTEVWIKGGYDEQLQILPRHLVKRKQISLLNVDNKTVTPAMVRDSIARSLSNNDMTISAYKPEEACATNEMKVYIASSFYGKTGEFGQEDNDGSTIYSIGVACTSNMAETSTGESATRTRMKDVISGTMVASAQYKPFKQFMCQPKSFGESSGMIDFIWMVDNSGSMVDEQAAVAATAKLFMNRLGTTGVDYRIGVAFTDAYTLDEVEPGKGYHKNLNTDPTAYYQRYIDENGLRIFPQRSNTIGLLAPQKDNTSGGASANVIEQVFQQAVTKVYTDQFTSLKCDRSEQFGGSSSSYLNMNLCGYGIEDGLKSVEYVLKSLTNPPLSVVRAAAYYGGWTSVKEECKVDGPRAETDCNKPADRCFASENVAPHCYTDDEADAAKCYDELYAFYDENKNAKCKFNLETIKLRDKALKYVIWVSDEMSRQFKEDSIADDSNPNYFTHPSYNDDLFDKAPICKNGYAVSAAANGDISALMATPWELFPTEYGPCYYDSSAKKCFRDAEKTDAHACNDNIKLATEKYNVVDEQGNEVVDKNGNKISRNKYSFERDADDQLPVNEKSTLAELKTYNEGQYNVIMHYLSSYLQFAGTGGIAGFAIVGDDATDNYDSKMQGGNGNCKYLVDGSADGADYGYDYILIARYLGALQKNPNGMYINEEGNFNFGGTAGLYASICNPKYDEIVENIVNDAVGRVASHNLKGYPISSTIQVAVKPASGDAFMLTRGAKSNGWTYNEAQNSIILNGVSNMTSDAYLAIAYVIWKKDEG